MALLTETNVPQAENITYFGDGTNEAHLIYNFALPPLVLHAFQTGTATVLADWARSLTWPSEESMYFNILASHDGIGLNPVRGILTEGEIEELARTVEKGGGIDITEEQLRWHHKSLRDQCQLLRRLGTTWRDD